MTTLLSACVPVSLFRSRKPDTSVAALAASVEEHEQAGGKLDREELAELFSDILYAQPELRRIA